MHMNKLLTNQLRIDNKKGYLAEGDGKLRYEENESWEKAQYASCLHVLLIWDLGFKKFWGMIERRRFTWFNRR
jgi:hypothetical protein